MVEIIGYNRFHSKNKDKDYISVWYVYPDAIDFGKKAGSCICSPEYLEKLQSAPERISVGYDREKKQNFLYLK